MNSSIMKWIAVGVCASAVTVSAQLPTAKFVTVDLNQVFNDYYKTPIASSKLKEAATSFAKEHEEMLGEFKKQVDDLNKLRAEVEDPAFTPEVREQKRKVYTEKMQTVQKGDRDIREFEASHRKMLDEQTQRMRQSILKEISEVIQKEARDAGYTMVLDKSGNTLNAVPAVVYAQDSIDITGEITKILNKNAPKPVDQPKPAPKKEEKKDDKK